MRFQPHSHRTAPRLVGSLLPLLLLALALALPAGAAAADQAASTDDPSPVAIDSPAPETDAVVPDTSVIPAEPAGGGTVPDTGSGAPDDVVPDTGCSVDCGGGDTCASNPGAPECQPVDDCTSNPGAPECQPVDDCTATPDSPECNPPSDCTDTPDAPECGPDNPDCTDTPEAPECTHDTPDCTDTPEAPACNPEHHDCDSTPTAPACTPIHGCVDVASTPEDECETVGSGGRPPSPRGELPFTGIGGVFTALLLAVIAMMGATIAHLTAAKREFELTIGAMLADGDLELGSDED
jgi:hypothetical protein